MKFQHFGMGEERVLPNWMALLGWKTSSHNPRAAWIAASPSSSFIENTGTVNSILIQWALQSDLTCSVCNGMGSGPVLGEWKGVRSAGREQSSAAALPGGDPRDQTKLRVRKHSALWEQLPTLCTDTGKCCSSWDFTGSEFHKSAPEAESRLESWSAWSELLHQAVLVTPILTPWTLLVPILSFASTVHLFPHFYK